MRQILKKNLFLNSTILKKICTQKSTFWLNLPRKIRKLCVLREVLKSTISMKKKFLKSMILKKKHFLKSMIFNKKVFVKSMVFIFFWQILYQLFYNASDLELKILQRVRF